MTLSEWGALGEVVGGFGIIVSLLYVGIQVRQNTNATKVATSHAFLDLHRDILGKISSEPEFRDIYWRGLAGLSNLQGSEAAAFYAWAIHTFRTWETFWYQWQEGAFDDRFWQGWKAQFVDLFQNKGILDAWETRKHQVSEAFRAYVELQIIVAPGRPLYEVHGTSEQASGA